MKKVIITGATSMIGVSILDEFINHNIDVIYAVVRKNCTKLNRIPKSNKIKIIECDIDHYENLADKIHDKCDVFYHIAWGLTGAYRNDDILKQADNISYTIRAIKAAKTLGCTKFIGAGSQAEYGKLDVDKISPNSPVDPVQAYGVAKYAAGKLALMEAEKLEIDCFWVRIFSVYGKYDKLTSMISTSLRKLLSNEKTEFTAGLQRWDYLYSADAGKAFYLIGEKSKGRKVYCLGSGEAHQLKWYIEKMGVTANSDAELGIGKIPYTSETVMNICADISNLSEDTGWKPETDFPVGIKNTVKEINEVLELEHTVIKEDMERIYTSGSNGGGGR